MDALWLDRCEIDASTDMINDVPVVLHAARPYVHMIVSVARAMCL